MLLLTVDISSAVTMNKSALLILFNSLPGVQTIDQGSDPSLQVPNPPDFINQGVLMQLARECTGPKPSIRAPVPSGYQGDWDGSLNVAGTLKLGRLTCRHFVTSEPRLVPWPEPQSVWAEYRKVTREGVSSWQTQFGMGNRRGATGMYQTALSNEI